MLEAPEVEHGRLAVTVFVRNRKEDDEESKQSVVENNHALADARRIPSNELVHEDREEDESFFCFLRDCDEACGDRGKRNRNRFRAFDTKANGKSVLVHAVDSDIFNILYDLARENQKEKDAVPFPNREAVVLEMDRAAEHRTRAASGHDQIVKSHDVVDVRVEESKREHSSAENCHAIVADCECRECEQSHERMQLPIQPEIIRMVVRETLALL